MATSTRPGTGKKSGKKSAGEPKTITVERIVITAPDGSPRIELGTSPFGEGEPYITLLDHNGKRRASLYLGLPFDQGEDDPMATAAMELCGRDAANNGEESTMALKLGAAGAGGELWGSYLHPEHGMVPFIHAVGGEMV